ncbi:hypothetical protein [Stakelama marina]|uniref:Circumsporozoite protein n=1 Tax=Stakelama marina TaxID=2826939 RepID=A0A8T4IAF6_9SPHN|nr:hypothetical protein [Stakelama marina]MBR0551540.1 hypothetical protein [Stakelama marina]
MKKIVFVAAAAGLMTLAACSSPENADNAAAENMAANLEMTADNYDAMADNATTDANEMMMENMADNAEAAADNIEDAE